MPLRLLLAAVLAHIGPACSPDTSALTAPSTMLAAPSDEDQPLVGSGTRPRVTNRASTPDPLAGWPTETFALPPGFAPELPTGSESLLFAPGWRNPESEEFWSYAFVMSIDEPVPDVERVDQIIEQYYNGLMASFASGREHEEAVRAQPVRVEVTRTASERFEATMHLIDAFATFEPMDLRVVIETARVTDMRSSVRVQVSSQPEGHEIWRHLDLAIQQILSARVER